MNPRPHAAPATPTRTHGPSRRALMRGAAWSVPVVAAATAAPAFALSSPDCVPGDQFDGIGRGRILTGNLLGLSLDEDRSGVELATLNGVTAQTPDGGSPGPSPDIPVQDTQNNNLSVSALGLLTVNLNGVTAPLADILQLPVNNDAGVYKQYGHVHQDGIQQGAAGYVTDDGSIRTDGSGSSGGMPTFGTVDLRKIISSPLISSLPLVAPLVDATTGVDALSLEVGALAGTAEQLQNCDASTDPTLERDYLVAGLRTVVEPADSSLVDGLVTSIANATVGLTINTGALTSTIQSLLSTLGLGGAIRVDPAVVSLTVDATQITGSALPVAEDSPIRLVFSDSSADLVTLDLGSLVGGLNNRAPNSVLFRDVGTQPTVSNLTSFLGDLVSELTDRLLKAVKVTVTARVRVLLIDAPITISGTLAQLRDGAGSVSLVGVPLGPITGALMTAVYSTVKGVLDTALQPGGAIHQLLVDRLLTGLVEPVLALLYGLLHIRLNAQNRPEANEPSTGGYAQPTYFSSLEWNRFDVAALHLSVVDYPQVLNLFLARGSVGPTSIRP